MINSSLYVLSQQVDPSGPLATLRRLLLSDASLAQFQRWMADRWYAVALGILAALLGLVSSYITRIHVYTYTLQR